MNGWWFPEFRKKSMRNRTRGMYSHRVALEGLKRLLKRNLNTRETCRNDVNKETCTQRFQGEQIYLAGFYGCFFFLRFIGINKK